MAVPHEAVGNAIPCGQPDHTGSGLLHHTGAFHADRGRQADGIGLRRGEQAFTGSDIHDVDTGMRDAHEHLALGKGRHRNVLQLQDFGPTILLDAYSFHDASPREHAFSTSIGRSMQR
jgi:hypothetical protein